MSDQTSMNVQQQDLMKFGIIPELIGRMPMIATLRSLTREDLIRVLTEPKNALTKQYQAMLRYDDVELVFEDDALGAIADQAVAKEIGARGLRSVMENLMLNIMFTVPSDKTIKKVIVTKECVEGNAEPEIIRA